MFFGLAFITFTSLPKEGDFYEFMRVTYNKKHLKISLIQGVSFFERQHMCMKRSYPFVAFPKRESSSSL